MSATDGSSVVSTGYTDFLQRLTAGRWFSLGTPVFLQLYNRPPRYNWNIVDSCVKHHHPNPIVIKLSMSFFNNGSRTNVYYTHHQHDQVKMKYSNINEYTSDYIENTNKKKTSMFYRSLFVLLYFFFLPLCCLFFFDILILTTPFVSFCHCVVCSSLIYWFWLPLLYFQLFLHFCLQLRASTDLERLWKGQWFLEQQTILRICHINYKLLVFPCLFFHENLYSTILPMRAIFMINEYFRQIIIP